MEIIRQTLDLEAEIGPRAWDLSIPEVRARTARREARHAEESVRLADAFGWGQASGTKAYTAWVRRTLGLPETSEEESPS